MLNKFTNEHRPKESNIQFSTLYILVFSQDSTRLTSNEGNKAIKRTA